MNHFYVITTFKVLPNLKRIRTVGIFINQKDAIEIIENDIGSLNEAGYYEWAIIEQRGYGLYSNCDHDLSLLYQFNRESYSWEKRLLSEMPEEIDYEHLVSLSEIG